MEICRCCEYKSAVDNLKFFTLGTLHHLIERIPSKHPVKPDITAFKKICKFFQHLTMAKIVDRN